MCTFNTPIYARIRAAVALLAIVSAALISHPSANAQTFNVIHDFNVTDGQMPVASLAQANDGMLYGTTQYGGTHSWGTVFRLSSSGSFTNLYNFSNLAGGNRPNASLLQLTDGNLYSTTFAGGSSTYGTVFKITSSGVVTYLSSFSDGHSPISNLIQAKDGNFYGTTSVGGLQNYGTVFKLTPSGVLTTLHSFDLTNGANPCSALVLGKDGALYGTTNKGGSAGVGIIYRISTNGTFSNIHTFKMTDGGYPYGPLTLASDGNFYGTTSFAGIYGAGTVFKLTPAYVLTTLHFFFDFEGSYLYSGLVQALDGKLYGSANLGGQHGYGSLYRISLDGVFEPLHSFVFTDGANPVGGLIQANDGNLYGTASGGGLNSAGVVYCLAMPPTDVSSQIQITRGSLQYNRITGPIIQDITLKNNSATEFIKPISLVLDSLPAGVVLTNKTGVTADTSPQNSPYINLWAKNLAPGKSVTITLIFSNPNQAVIKYKTRVLIGTGNR